MSRILISAAMSAVVAVMAAPAGVHGQEIQVPDEVMQVAGELDLDPIDLLGAMYTTGLSATAYTCAADGVLCPPAPPVSACGWPICGPLGQRIYCIEKVESNHGAAMYNRTPVWDGEHAQGWLGFLPSTARTWGVVIGNRASEWSGAARMIGTGAGRQFAGVAMGWC